MRYIAKGGSVLCITAGLICAAEPNALADTPAVAGRATVRASTGAEVYEHICQGCHMPQGQGAVGAGTYPKLAGNAALSSWQYVALTVLNGRAGMPAFGKSTEAMGSGPRGGYLSDAQIADVVNFVRTHFGNRYRGEVTAAQVATLPHPGARAPED